MATKRKKTKKKSAISSCASTLGKRGGKKTLSLGHGIFADVYKKTRKRKKKAAPKKKRAGAKRKRTTRRK